MRRRRVLAAAAAAAGLAGCSVRAPADGTALSLASPALTDDGRLPRRFTCDGEAGSPPLIVESVPGGTAALAVVAEADLGVFNRPVFWAIWNLPPDVGSLPGGVPRTPTVASLGGARQSGQPDGRPGYVPPCPPPGRETVHRFDLLALEEPLGVEAGTPSEAAVEAAERALLARDRISVTYTRPVSGTRNASDTG
jgi:hypothetical protein